jgi:hypothetical protein
VTFSPLRNSPPEKSQSIESEGEYTLKKALSTFSFLSPFRNSFSVSTCASSRLFTEEQKVEMTITETNIRVDDIGME